MFAPSIPILAASSMTSCGYFSSTSYSVATGSISFSANRFTSLRSCSCSSVISKSMPGSSQQNYNTLLQSRTSELKTVYNVVDRNRQTADCYLGTVSYLRKSIRENILLGRPDSSVALAEEF